VSTLLLLKLLLAPTLIALVSLVQARWGDKVGGRFIGLPITTLPFITVIWVQEGRTFAGQSAHGAVAGQISLIVFLWVYAFAALRLSWIPALSFATFACLVSGYFATLRVIPMYALAPIIYSLWFIALKNWPKYAHEGKVEKPPKWELPARLLATVILIFVLSQFARFLGPNLAGAIASYPVIITVLGGFSHRRNGPTAIVASMHGLMQVMPLAITIMTLLAIIL
jgi:hypothetical protein